jgi:hypothetical protein
MAMFSLSNLLLWVAAQKQARDGVSRPTLEFLGKCGGPAALACMRLWCVLAAVGYGIRRRRLTCSPPIVVVLVLQLIIAIDSTDVWLSSSRWLPVLTVLCRVAFHAWIVSQITTALAEESDRPKKLLLQRFEGVLGRIALATAASEL